MFKFGLKKNLAIEDPDQEPQLCSKSNSFSLISPRPHHSIKFGQKTQKDKSEKIQKESQLLFNKKVLPTNYAEKLLELEIEIELNEDVTIDTFQELVSTYMTGVEYYESVQDKRYIYFQRKLNSLMMKPSFMICSKKAIQNTSSQKNEPQISEVEIKKKDFQEQQTKLNLELIYGQNESKQAKVHELVDSHTQSAKRMDTIIQKDILSQQTSILDRLQKRKSQGLQRTVSLPQLSIENVVMSEESLDESTLKKQLIPNEIIQEEEEETNTRKASIQKRKNKTIVFPPTKDISIRT